MKIHFILTDIRLLDEWYLRDGYTVPVLYKLNPNQDFSKNLQFK